jgi:hypothetical protein
VRPAFYQSGMNRMTTMMMTMTMMTTTITVRPRFPSPVLSRNNTHTFSVDVDELRRECGFSTTTYDPTSSYTQLLLVAATGNSVSQSTGMTSASSIAASASTASNPAAATITETTSVAAGETGNGAAMATALPRMENLGAVAGVAALAVAAWV